MIKSLEAMSIVVMLALAAGCPQGESKDKTASADKPAAAKKAEPTKDDKGGGGSDEVAKAEPDEPDEPEPPVDEDEGYDPRVAQAAKVAREIASNPASADDVLAKENLDREKLDALMYEIASDPDLTEQYRIARGI